MSAFTRLPLAALLVAAGFGLMSAPASAEPKVVKVGRDHYTGTWLEIARTPMKITDGCVAAIRLTSPRPAAISSVLKTAAAPARRRASFVRLTGSASSKMPARRMPS